MTNTKNKFGLLIVSGLSGSGKTVALNALEDLNYYCVDNMPAVMLPQFARLLRDQYNGFRDVPVAVSIDSRNRQFLASLQDCLKELETLDIDYRIVFLEAEEKTLVTRFSETRRKHPLTDDQTPLIDGIRQELQLLTPLAELAARRVDTSLMTPHELTRRMRDIAGIETFLGPVVRFESFGFKYGTPMDADFVFDVRCLPNPHWHEQLKPLTGMDKPVQDFLEKESSVNEMFEQIRQFIERWLPDFEQENRSYITVAVGCTGGRHRSVFMVERLNQHFASCGVQIQIWHRELSL